MNLFVSDKSPIISARNLDDKRVKHMPKETLEMLIMSVYKNHNYIIHSFIIWGGEERKYNINDLFTNSVTEWVARKRVNTWWTYRHLFALFDEYKFRFGINHYLYDLALSLAHFFKPMDNEPRTFCNASGEVGSNIVELYKKCLLRKWFVTDEIKPVYWTKRGQPSWVTINNTEQSELFPSKQPSLFDDTQFDDLPF